MENLSNKRRRQIAEAAFDRFVVDYILSSNAIEENQVNTRFLNELAKKLNCDAHALSISISKSCGRITQTPVQKNLPREEEDKVMMAAAKFHIQQIKVPLKNFKREFGNVTSELNNQSPGLNLKKKELFEFVYPIYLQALEEIFEN